ncbi:hypothetical protein EW146_g45 [Bondarzewia mesenterica]|uniref:FHA domain-containing protein n=1 Tax=Bondarzewia mesenterica TaxID=1095465 RepID=A0A4S4M8B1_9AGAM|nr:hypothetical protein EW146_g45 [Bondarzewia mesenterica]
MNVMLCKTISLSPLADSAPFTARYIPLAVQPVILGREKMAGNGAAAPTNGLFSIVGGESDDLPVSPVHAELYTKDRHVYIKDLDSVHGTWVDDEKIKMPKLLETGSIIELGIQLEQSADTPDSSIDTKRPIRAKVTIVG